MEMAEERRGTGDPAALLLNLELTQVRYLVS